MARSSFEGIANKLKRLGVSTYKTIQDMHNLCHSAGRATGGAVTDNGDGTVTVAAGTGFIRDSSGLTITLYFFDWLASTIAISDGTIRYLGIDYNSGAPQVTNKATDSWSYTYDFPLAIVYREGADIHVIDNFWTIYDNPGMVLRRFNETDHIARDEMTGGLMISESGTRSIAITSGALWAGLVRRAISAFDSSSNYAITAVNQGTKTFTVSGDHVTNFIVDHQFRIVGSSGNDGVYTITASVLNGGNTDVTVDEAIADATVDGNIYYQVFDRYYRDGAGGWLFENAQYQWHNTQYDNNAGAPTTLTASKFSVQYFFIGTDGILVSLYGQSQYTTLAEALNETVPNTLPTFISKHSELIGRVIFQKSDAAAQAVQSAWDVKFEMSQPTDHGNLAGLADDDHAQYLLLAGRSGGQVAYGGIDAGDDLELHSSSHGTKGMIYLGSNSAYDEVNDRLGIGTTTPQFTLDINGRARVAAGTASAPTVTFGTHNDGFYEDADGELKVAISTNPQFKFLQTMFTTISGAFLRNVVPSSTIPDICPVLNDLDTGIGSPQADSMSFIAGGVHCATVTSSGIMGLGTTTPHASAILDLTTTAKGFLPPRMTTAQRNAIGNPQTGLIIYNTTTGQLEEYNGAGWSAAGINDHGLLDGLGDDDHSQYALLAGRADGQNLIGGVNAGGNLGLRSTSNAGKGKIYFGAGLDEYYDEANDLWNIKTVTVSGTITTTGAVNVGAGLTIAGTLNAQENDIDNVGDIIHDDAVASDWILRNQDQDKDILFYGNDGGADTLIMGLDVSAGQLSGMIKSVSGLLTNAIADTDYLVNIVADTTPQLGGTLDCQENGIDNVGDITHDDGTASDWIFRNEDSDKDILFYGLDGAADTLIMGLDVSAGQLSGMIKAVTGLLTNAIAGTDYLTDIVQDTTPQLGANLDAQEYDLDNVGNIIHDKAVASDFTIQNIDEDKDIIFSGNDGGAQTDIFKLDVSAGQLSGAVYADSGFAKGVILTTSGTVFQCNGAAVPSWSLVGKTQGIITQGDIQNRAIAESVADDGQLMVATGTGGFGFAQAGDNEEYAQFSWNAAGTVILWFNSDNVVNTDTDTKFCIYDVGTGIAIKNRLGAGKTIRAVLFYS